MKRYNQISAFILSGGASSRMGKEKGLLEFGGEPLIVRTARLLEPLVAAITVVGSPERYRSLGLSAVADMVCGIPNENGGIQGPLAGIATALSVTGTTWNLILACDLPYLTAEWLDWLLARAMLSGKEIVMPRTSRGLEPLAAVYRRECAPRIVASLGRGIRKVTEAMQEFRIEFVTEQEWRGFDPDGKILRNMNTPADYEEARRCLEAK
jgi:molybdopterin-guanine dinucleotide biosynthesis protein A